MKIKILIGFTIISIVTSAGFGYSQKMNSLLKNRNSDTLFVSESIIVFFTPKKEELDAIYKKEGNNSETYEVISDFRYYAQIIADSLSKLKSEIKTYFADQSIIAINQINNNRLIFNRKENLNHSVGAIFSDGKHSPQYEYGVLTDVDYWTIIKKYFTKNGH